MSVSRRERYIPRSMGLVEALDCRVAAANHSRLIHQAGITELEHRVALHPNRRKSWERPRRAPMILLGENALEGLGAHDAAQFFIHPDSAWACRHNQHAIRECSDADFPEPSSGRRISGGASLRVPL